MPSAEEKRAVAAIRAILESLDIGYAVNVGIMTVARASEWNFAVSGIGEELSVDDAAWGVFRFNEAAGAACQAPLRRAASA